MAALSAWCAAARVARSDAQMQRIEQRAASLLDALSREQLWALAPQTAPEVTVRKAAILKLPESDGEKGVMIISFESQWVHLLALGPDRLARFLEQYQLVLAPTWSPPHHPVNLLFPRLVRGPIFTTISNDADLEIFPRLHASYRPLPLLASSWVNPDLYAPRPASERDIDLVMVANFGRYKRHHVLFQALANGGTPSLKRIVLIGQPQDGRTTEILMNEADLFGVRNRIEVRSRISDAELVDCLCRAKASFVASLREGSCVAVVEAMMGGAPVGLLRGAAMGSARFLNEETGRWLDPGNLANELEALVKQHTKFRPRGWLLQNGIECRTSRDRLNDALRADAERSGRVWRRDLWIHHWRPDPLLLEEANVPPARGAAERLLGDFGLRLVSPQLLPPGPASCAPSGGSEE